MSRKPKYQLSTMNVGDQFQINTTNETSQKDVHCLRSAISQFKRLHNKKDATYEISLLQNDQKHQIVCKRTF